MNVYEVTIRNPVGGEMVYRVVASTETSASNQALLRVQRETGCAKDVWMVALVMPA